MERSWSLASCCFAFAALLSAPAWAADAPKAGKQWLYVGTYTGKASKGIYRFTFDPATGTLSDKALAAETVNPSYLAIRPDHRFLYAVGETGGGKKGGAVHAFAIDQTTGKLTKLNTETSGGGGPCYIATDKAGKHVLVANYGGGSASVLPIDDDGKLGTATAFQQHKGTGADPGRQEAPHAHSINLDPANRFAFVADLGLDKVLIYRYDTAKGTLKKNDPPSASVAAGAGPRHLDFSPDGRNAYVINELNSTMTAFAYDAEGGKLKELEAVSTLPKGFKGKSYCADVHVHPSGKFVYGSNRGHDSIVVYARDVKSGRITPVQYQDAGIKTPRNFVIDPTGKFLLVGNQGSDSIVVFRIDADTGKLEATEGKVSVGAPVCLKFMPRP